MHIYRAPCMLTEALIWSICRSQGLPGRRLQLGRGGRPTDKSMGLRSGMCQGTSLSSRAVCPKTEMRRAARISPNGVRPVVRACCLHVDTELVMGHFFKTQPNPKFLDPTQSTKVSTRPNPTHHRHLVWHIRLYRKLYTTTVTHQTSSLSMKVIIQLQYSLTDSKLRVFHDVKNITQSSLHPTQPNSTHQKLKN